MRKSGFKLNLIEAELNLLDYLMLVRKKIVFEPKIDSSLFFVREFSKQNHTLSYSVENLTRVIFCESVLGVSHMSYGEDFAHFGQKEQFKMEMKHNKTKMT